ncbi:VOC family protein [Streptomyces lomondensis]|uniref:Hydroxylase n=1 Tax=Streptomyces lomondensis TaxID=68229 RepID=A0ABQ2X3I4_9ACTN|nr:VOC family protein [Streptomyces lomondensis]MCF0079930.1 VOC family protein [Streptomyces lomondensis]GGW97367.1 hydroxylase [Streptomyces lomondensis]
MKITRHPAGAPCWADLDTPDVASARAFYGSLFGWETLELPGGYVNFVLRGEKIVGAVRLREGQEHSAGWSVYFMSDDLNGTTKAVEEAGGRVVSPPTKVSVAGSAAVYEAPDGAVFGAWEPDKHTGSGLVREPSTLSWFGLSTPDVDGAKAFYAQVFGWTAAVPPAGGAVAHLTFVGGVAEFGGITSRPEGAAGWTLHFGVADVDSASATAVALGGTVVSEPAEAPGVGRIAVLKDPAGVTFALVRHA